MVQIRMNAQGVEIALTRFVYAQDAAPRMMEQALMQVCQKIMRESKRRVPVGRTGKLKASATIKNPERIGTHVSITLGYGGAASRYALIVHNMPRSNKFTKSGTGPHYLIDPVQEAMPELDAELNRRIITLFNRSIGAK